jgi:hypothetical protein
VASSTIPESYSSLSSNFQSQSVSETEYQQTNTISDSTVLWDISHTVFGTEDDISSRGSLLSTIAFAGSQVFSQSSFVIQKEFDSFETQRISGKGSSVSDKHSDASHSPSIGREISGSSLSEVCYTQWISNAESLVVDETEAPMVVDEDDGSVWFVVAVSAAGCVLIVLLGVLFVFEGKKKRRERELEEKKKECQKGESKTVTETNV